MVIPRNFKNGHLYNGHQSGVRRKYKPPPPFPPHLSPKIPQKIQKKREELPPKILKKKRGEEKGSGEALPDYALVICR